MVEIKCVYKIYSCTKYIDFYKYDLMYIHEILSEFFVNYQVVLILKRQNMFYFLNKIRKYNKLMLIHDQLSFKIKLFKKKQ